MGCTGEPPPSVGMGLVAAEDGDGPGDVAEEPDGDAGGVDEADERLDNTIVDYVVAQGGAVASNVAKGPHGLRITHYEACE